MTIQLIVTVDPNKKLNSSKLLGDKKVIRWESLPREEQIALLNALADFHNLFFKFLKPESDDNKD